MSLIPTLYSTFFTHAVQFPQVYYVLVANPDSYPPDFSTYINSVSSKIGANATWSETNYNVYSNFGSTGDWMRTKKPYLENVINAGVRTFLFDGQVSLCPSTFNGIFRLDTCFRWTSFAITWASKQWYDVPCHLCQEHSLTYSKDQQPLYQLFRRVQRCVIPELHRQRSSHRTVQKRRYLLVRARLWCWTRGGGIQLRESCLWRSSAAVLLTDHVKQQFVEHISIEEIDAALR